MRRLLIRPGAIGDCILAFPALEFSRAAYTEVWISTAVVPLIHFADRVHSIQSTGLDFVGLPDVDIPDSLRRRLAGFDEIVSWYGSNRAEFRSALEALCRKCIFHQALPTSTMDGHAVDFFARQVGAPDGLIPRLPRTQSESRDTVVIHPFSGSKRKNWPLPLFRDLASSLNRNVEWLAGPEEDLPEACRFENLDDLAGWLGGASLYIGNDSGITHLAAATGVKTLALFGPTAPETWAPRGQHVTVLRRDPPEALPAAVALETANRLLHSP